MTGFNAAAARAKRPFPLWVDAFLRDTQHLEADEVGAYMLILMVMWSRDSCDYPDDDARLARACRVSLRLWKTRVGPVIRPFFRAAGGMLVSKRLREEATYVERQCKAQSDRKSGQKSSKSLKDNNRDQTADGTRVVSADHTREHPSQQPNIREEPRGSSLEGPRKRVAPKTRITPNALISDRMRAAAEQRGLSDAEAEAQFVKFRDWAVAHGKAYADWDAGWRNWLTSPYFAPALGAVHTFPVRRQGNAERLDDHLDALKARLAVQRLE